MKNKLEQKIDKGQKLNRQEKDMKRKSDEGNFGDLYIPPVRVAEAQAGEYNEYSKLDGDGNQVRAYTGMVILNPAIEYAEGTYNLVGMNDGDIQVAISALDGSITAGNGHVIIDIFGITLDGYVSEGETESHVKWVIPDGTAIAKVQANQETLNSTNAMRITAVGSDDTYNPTQWNNPLLYINTEDPTINAISEISLTQLTHDTFWTNETNISEGKIEFTVADQYGTENHLIMGYNYTAINDGTTFITPNVKFYEPNNYDFDISTKVLRWNPNRDTLDLVQTVTTLQLGQQVHYYCINQTGSDIPLGTAVMFDGSLGASGIIKIKPAIATGVYNSIYIMGITAQDIVDGETGKVTFFGEIQHINTSSWTAGTILYLNPSVAGGLTSTVPSAPNLKYAIAATLNQKVNGTIFVRAIYGQNISELNDVQITTPSSNQVIKYDGTKWINGTVPTPSMTLDDLTDVTITTPSANQILKYNGSKWVNGTASTSTTPNASYLPVMATDFGTTSPFSTNVFNSGNLNNKAGEASHPGIQTIASAATNNSGYGVMFGNSDNNQIILGGVEAFEIILRPLSNNSNIVARFGWQASDSNSTPANALAFLATGNGTTWDLGVYPRNGGSGSVTNFTTLSMSTWYKLKMTNGGTGAVNLYVYNMSGTLLSSYNYTGTVTANAMNFGVVAYRTNNVSTNIVDVDYMSLYTTAPYTR